MSPSSYNRLVYLPQAGPNKYACVGLISPSDTVAVLTDELFGIHIDQCLTFTYHRIEMCKKTNSHARALARLSSMLDTESKFMIFSAFVV